MGLDIGVLGSLRASVAGVSFVPTASKPRQVLAMLAVNFGSLVKASTLMDEIWGLRPPRSAIPTLHTYVSNLRRNIAQALAGNYRYCAREILVTEHAGYRLNADRRDVDAGEYGRLSSVGRRAIERGNHAAAADALRAALAQWRGPALVDVVIGSRLEIEIRRLEEFRLTDLDLRIDADLRLGRHHQLLGELAALCAEHPLLEKFHAQYMLALHRSGRRSRALEVYHQLRLTMITQLGIDPSMRLQHLHQAILCCDPDIDDLSMLPDRWVAGALAGSAPRN